jgi:hypothetical protein
VGVDRLTRAAGLIVVQPDDRAHRFAERRRRWRSRSMGVYAKHADLEPYAHIILASMFDRALRIVGPGRCYALSAADVPTVRLNNDPAGAKPWFWYTAGGCAEGRGIYELWAWRFDIPVCLAAEEIWTTIHSGASDDR